MHPGHTGWEATFASGAAAFLDLLDYMAPLNSCAQYSASNFPIYVERPLDRHEVTYPKIRTVAHVQLLLEIAWIFEIWYVV